MKNFPIAIFALTLGAFSIGMTEFVIMGLLQSSQQIDQEFYDHMLLNEYEFFVLPLFSLLFAYLR